MEQHASPFISCRWRHKTFISAGVKTVRAHRWELLLGSWHILSNMNAKILSSIALLLYTGLGSVWVLHLTTEKPKNKWKTFFFFSFFFSLNLKTQTLVPPFLQITIIKSLEISLPKPVSITSLTQLISKYDPINMIIVDSNAKYV